MKIQNKIIIFILIIILFFGTIASITTFILTKNIFTKQLSDNLINNTLSQSQEVYQILRQSRDIAILLSERPIVREYLSNPKDLEAKNQIETTYLDGFGLGDMYSAITILDKHGIARASTNIEIKDQDFSKTEYFNESKNNKVSMNVTIEPTTNKLGYYFTSPIYSNEIETEVMGVAVVKLIPKYAESGLLEHAKKGLNVMLTDERGIVILSSNSSKLFHSLGPLKQDILDQILKKNIYGINNIPSLNYQILMDKFSSADENPQSYQIFDDQDNEEEIVSIAKINDFPLYIIFEGSLKEITQESLRSSLTIAGFVAATAIATTLTLIIIMKLFVEKQLQEQQLIASQASELRKFKAVSELSIEMIIFADSDGVVLWGNHAMEIITGFALKEAIGKKAGLLWGKLMTKEWYQKLWKTVKVDKKIFTSEILNHRKNGESFWSSISIYPLLNENNEVQFLVATQRDITHDKEVDQMKTDFISVASHQLRTPLSSMKWFLEMLANGDMGKINTKQSKTIADINLSNERMIDLVNSLLNISRIESGKLIVDPKLTNIKELTQEVATELKEQFQSKNQKLILNFANAIPPVMLDKKMIRQVLINLLTNAYKYTSDQGLISITLSLKKNDLLVEIEDNGYGIPKTEQSKLFERFFRASNILKIDTNGTGLGLYLSRVIITSSGGKIWFKSTEGKGTKFSFTIPLTGMKPKKGVVRLT